MLRHPLLPALLLWATAASAAAQNPFDLDVQQSQSNFTWSGTTTVGPIVGNPSNAFQMDGSQLASILPAPGNGYGTVELVGGDVFTVPDLHGKIPNAFSFLPPLATIDVLGLHLSVTSSPFTPASGGGFTADVVLEALSGTLVVTPLGSTPQVTDLTGLTSSPSATTGSIATVGPGGVVTLSLPVDNTFPFSDPTSGISGSITVVGTLTALWTPELPAVYCTPKVNSLGCTPAIGASGLPRYTQSAAPFTLQATQVVNQQPGLLFYGLAEASSPFQGAFLCAAPPIVRTPVQLSGGNPPPLDCSGTYVLDFNAHIQGGADPALVPGQRVYAQYWSRDPGDPFSTSLTAGVRFTIVP